MRVDREALFKQKEADAARRAASKLSTEVVAKQMEVGRHRMGGGAAVQGTGRPGGPTGGAKPARFGAGRAAELQLAPPHLSLPQERLELQRLAEEQHQRERQMVDEIVRRIQVGGMCQ